MKRSIMHKIFAYTVALCLATLPVLQNVNAAIIPTDAAIEYTERQQQIDRIHVALARESVQQILVDFGVAPEDANDRVQSLTAAELEILEGQLADLPAGGSGFVEVVGIVAIVLVILELLNVTNFFSEF